MFAAAYVSVRSPALSCYSWISACRDYCPFSCSSTFLFFSPTFSLASASLHDLFYRISPLLFYHTVSTCSDLKFPLQFLCFCTYQGYCKISRYPAVLQRCQLSFLKMFLVPNPSSLKLPGWQTISISTVQQTFYSVEQIYSSHQAIFMAGHIRSEVHHLHWK